MWLSVGDLGTGVTVGSPNIVLNTSDSPSPSSAGSGFDWSAILKSPYFYAVLIVILFVYSRRK